MYQTIRNAVAMVAAVILFNLGACGPYITPDDASGDAGVTGDVNNVPDRQAPPGNGIDDFCRMRCTALCTSPDRVTSNVCYCMSGGVSRRLDETQSICPVDDAGRPQPDVIITTDSGSTGNPQRGDRREPDAYCRDTWCPQHGQVADHIEYNGTGWDCVCRAAGNTDAGTCSPAPLPCATPGDVSFALAATDCRCISNCVGHGGPRQLTCAADRTWQCICSDATSGMPGPDAGVAPPVDSGVVSYPAPDPFCTMSCTARCATATRLSLDRATCFCSSGGVERTLGDTPNTCSSPDAGVTDSGVAPVDSGTGSGVVGSRFVYRVRFPMWALANMDAISFRDGWYRIRACTEGASGEFRMAADGATGVYQCTSYLRPREFIFGFSRTVNPCSSLNADGTRDYGRCSAIDQGLAMSIAQVELYELRPAPDGRRFDTFRIGGAQPAVELFDGQYRFIDPAGTPTNALPRP